jgi:hypothetical protein
VRAPRSRPHSRREIPGHSASPATDLRSTILSYPTTTFARVGYAWRHDANAHDPNGTITEPNIDRVEVTPNSDPAKKKLAQLRGGFFIARGIPLNDPVTNHVKGEAFDELGKHADTTNTSSDSESGLGGRAVEG